MSISSGFFNSVSGDRTYNADDISNYLGGLISNGVFETVGNRCEVVAASGMNVIVKTGKAFINCHYASIDTAETLSLAASSAAYRRIDAIVLRYSATTRDISLVVIQGTNSTSPNPPALVRTADTYDICLARVLVDIGVTTISQSKITDTRGNTSLCGFVHGIVEQVNTTDLFTQYQAYCDEKTAEMDAYFAEQQEAFDSWFGTLTSDLNVGVQVVKYQHTAQVTGSNVTEINIGIEQYAAGDILLVHLGGVLLIEDVEYTIDGEGSSAKIILAEGLKGSNTVTFLCLHSVAGGSVGGGGIVGGNTFSIVNGATITTLISGHETQEG